MTIEDSSSTQQIIGGGNILRVNGTTNEIEAVVSATDTLTIGLPNAVTVATSLTAPTLTGGSIQISGNTITATDSTAISFGSEALSTTGNITAKDISAVDITGTGTTHTLGTVEISGNTIRSTDSTLLTVNDSLTVNNTLKSGVTSINPAGSANITSTTGFTVFGSTIVLEPAKNLVFEGTTADDFEISLNGDPTADRTITLPDESGTVITTGSTNAISEGMMANDAIGQNELKSVVQLQILNSSSTPLKTLYVQVLKNGNILWQ